MAAKKGTKKTTSSKKTTAKSTKNPTKSAPQLRKDANPAGSWPFPVYTKC